MKVTIGLPVYNGENFLVPALESLMAQSLRDFRVLIADNASTDRTSEIIKSYAAKDPRIVYWRNDQNIGAAPNFNKLFHASTTPYFKWMAHDDVLAPTYLETMLDMLESDPPLSVAHSAIWLLDDDGRRVPIINGIVKDPKGRKHHPFEPMHMCEGDDPAERFDQAMRKLNWTTGIFGLMRADMMRRTHLHQSFYEADRVMLAEMALLGPFRQHPSELYGKRLHGGVSVHKPFKEQARMIDPNIWPGPKGMRLRLAYINALTVTDLTPRQFLACAITVARVTARNEIMFKAISKWRDWRNRPHQPA